MTTDDLIEKLKRYPIPSFCGFVVLAALVSFYFRMDMLTELDIEREKALLQARQVEDNIVAGSSLEDHVVQMRALLGSLEERVVNYAELATNLRYFYELESATGVALSDLRQGQAASGKPGDRSELVGIDFTVMLSGSFAQIVAYLDELEKGRQIYKLKSFNVQKGRDASGSSLTLSLNLQLLGWP
jgi:Tfp pilus assembly protein PilO